MALVRWNPWSGLLGLQQEMDLMMRRLTGESTPLFGLSTRTWVPAVDMFHRGDDLVIRAELPGIDPDNDVDITFQEGVLTIRGERRHEERTDGEGMHGFESAVGSFSRSVALPDGVKEEDIRARYENGILEVVVPGVAEMTGAKRIPIEVGGKRKALTTKGRKS
jgi:HSP20 family protein